MICEQKVDDCDILIYISSDPDTSWLLNAIGCGHFKSFLALFHVQFDCYAYFSVRPTKVGVLYSVQDTNVLQWVRMC